MCLMVSTVCLADDHIISPNQLPAAAKNYIQDHFNGQRIAYAEIDYDYGFKKYEVRLTNGVELKFDARGNCYEIDRDADNYSAGIQFPQVQAGVRIVCGDDDDDDFDFDFDDDLFDD